MGILDFVTDDKLRKTLEISLEYIFRLHNRSVDETESSFYKEETCRVIILYVISFIEAILLFIYRTRGDKMERFEYKYIQHLPSEYKHKGRINHPVVIAVQEKIERKDYEIGLNDLVKFFENKKLLLSETATNILSLNDVRNTFHFSKARNQVCDIERVEEALSLLVYIIDKAPRALRKN
ncbi:TPA: hypothetical protein DEP96_01795 [Candidatus Uhrbacteria bacterium]|nr:hypothetical protein [Candidatus Uhrbacteria bacterium]